MRILLVSPNIKGILGGVNRIQPPLGLAYLASYIKNHHDVMIYDCAIEGWNNIQQINSNIISIGEPIDTISKKISNFMPDIVGISVLFGNLMDSAIQIAEICKQINPSICVVFGGNYITNSIRDWSLGIHSQLYNKAIDYYFSSESELTFRSFLEQLPCKTEKNVSGVSYFCDKTLVSNPLPKFLDITSCLDPSWELFSMEKYFSVGLFHSAQSYSSRVLPVMASRGCPEKCQFCTTPFTWGSSVRWKDPEKLYLEMKSSVSKYKIGEIQFQDDTLTANLSNLYKLCQYMKEFNIPWCTPNGIKLNYHLKNQSEMFGKMKESGCYQITLACESGVQRVLDTIIRKNTKVSQFSPVIQQAKDAGLFVHTFWVLGFPGETYDEMKQTIEIASTCGADSFSVSILSPLPGTPIYHKVIKENLWWNEECKSNNTLFRKSLIKTDGFESPESFEHWADEQNIHLNSILEKNNPARYANVIKNRGVTLTHSSMRKIKQT